VARYNLTHIGFAVLAEADSCAETRRAARAVYEHRALTSRLEQRQSLGGHLSARKP
jgi:hypothetical protein